MSVSRHKLTIFVAGTPTAGKYVYIFQQGQEAAGAAKRLQATDAGDGEYLWDIEHANLKAAHSFDIGIWDVQPSESDLTSYTPADKFSNLPMFRKDWALLVDTHMADTTNPHTVTLTQVATAEGDVLLAAFISASAGVGDAGKTLKLDATGKVDISMIAATVPAAHKASHNKGGGDEVDSIDDANIVITDAGGHWAALKLNTLTDEIGAIVKSQPGTPTAVASSIVAIQGGLAANVTISWNAPAGGADVYWVELQKQDGSNSQEAWTDETGYTYTVMENGNYRARARAQNIGGQVSAWTAWKNFAVTVIEIYIPIKDEVMDARVGHPSLGERITSILSAGVDWQNVRIIAKDGGQYKTLQAGIDSFGDNTQMTLLTMHGTYIEDLTVPAGKTVAIVGLNAQRCEWKGRLISGVINSIENIIILANSTNIVLPLDGVDKAFFNNVLFFDGLHAAAQRASQWIVWRGATLVMANCRADAYNEFLYADGTGYSGATNIVIEGSRLRSRHMNTINLNHGGGVDLVKAHINDGSLITKAGQKCVASNNVANTLQIASCKYVVQPEAVTLALSFGAVDNVTNVIDAEADLGADVYYAI